MLAKKTKQTPEVWWSTSIIEMAQGPIPRHWLWTCTGPKAAARKTVNMTVVHC
jgi:hypothetical protein